MTNHRSGWTICATTAIALAAGCASSDSTSATQQASASDPGAREMHEPPGPELLPVAALHHLDLKPDQRTAIEHALHALGPRHAIEAFGEVAAEVRAGAIDEDRVLAKLDGGASSDRATAIADAVAALHATLTPEQRRALVDGIGARVDAHVAAHARNPAAMLDHLVAALSLTDGQRATIEQILAAQRPPSDATPNAPDALRARLQAFAADRFDAAAFATPPKEMRDHVQRTLHALAAIVPVLTAAQREALATMIEARAAHGG